MKVPGDKKVQDWTHHRSGLGTTIYLRGTYFVALFLERHFDAPDINILKAKMDAAAEHWINMEWQPMMKVEVSEPRHGYRDTPEGNSVQLAMKRFYISQSPTGEFFKVGWDVEPDHRKAQMESYSLGRGGYGAKSGGETLKLLKFPLGAPFQTQEGTYLMDYSDEVWAKGQFIIEGIKQLQRKIKELFSTKKGLQMLLGGAGDHILIKESAE